MGKPVYAKLVEFGSLPNATSKNVAFAAEGVVEYPVDVKARTENILLPAWTNVGDMTATFACYVIGNNIYIHTDYDRSNVTAQVLVKYTKTTDT